MSTVTCVGIATLDLIFGVETFPERPGKHRAHRRDETGGGVAANAAVTVASLGGGASFIGCLGDDTTGDHIVSGLQLAGIDVSAVRRVEGAPSPLSSVLVDSSGERLIVNHAGADLFDRGQPVQPDEVADTDVVLADMRWPAGAVSALRLAREAGIPAIVDCDHDPSTNRGTEILQAASHIIFSLPTLAAFTNANHPMDALVAASRHTDAWVAATDGERGTYWLESDELLHLPAFRVDVVDTLGAGDVFHGAFALGIGEGMGVEAALRFGSAAAALSCTRTGGRAAIPNRQEVDTLLAVTETPLQEKN